MLALPPILAPASAVYSVANEQAFRTALTRYFQQQRTDAAVVDPSQAPSTLNGTLVKSIGGGVLGNTLVTEAGGLLTVNERLRVTGTVALASDVTVAGFVAIGGNPVGSGGLRLSSPDSVWFAGVNALSADGTGDIQLGGTGVGNIRVVGAAGLAVTISVGGTVDVALPLTGAAATFSGTLTANGNIVLGDTTADLLTGNALVARDWLPQDASWHLGDLTHRWSQIHASSSIALWRTASTVGSDVGFALRSSAANTQMWNTLPINAESGDTGFDLAITRTIGAGTSTWLTVTRSTGAYAIVGDATLTGTVTGSSTLQGTRLISTIATGTAPLTVASTTVVTNLNADLLDGQTGTYYTDPTNLTGFGAAGGYLRSTGSAWARVSGVAAADVTPGTFNSTFGAGDYTFPGHLLNATDNTYDIGAGGTFRFRNGSFGTTVYAGTSLQSPVLDSGSGDLLLRRASVLRLTLGAASATVVGDLLSSTDNTVDVGAVAANRYRTGYFGTSVVAPTGTFTNVGGTLTTVGQPNVTTMANLTTIGTLVAGAVPASLVTAGTFGAGSYTFPTDLTVIGPSTARMYFGVTGETVNLVVRRVVSAVAGANFIGEKARGTFGSETYANGSDPIARFAGRGWDGTGFTKSSAEWVVEAVENQSLTALGGRMRLQIIPAGSTTETDQLNFINNKVTPATAGTYAFGDLTLPFGTLHVGESFFTTVGGASLHVQYAKNTLAAPALPVNNDVLGGLLFEGWNGTSAYTEQAAVNAQASQAWSTVGPAYGTRLLFKVTPNSSGASEITPFVLDHDGVFTPTAANTNTYDLGRSTATVRSGYFGTSLTSPVYDTAATDNILKRIGTTMLTLGSATATFAKGDLTLTPASAIAGIHTDTADASDNAVLKFGPGSSFSVTRGAIVQLHGNEHANTGQLHLGSGNVTGASVLIQNKGTTVIAVTDLLAAVTGAITVSTTAVIGTDPTGSQTLRVGGLTHLLSTTANQLRLAYSTTQYWDSNVTSVGALELLPTGTTPNLALFAAGSYGGGKGVLFFANSTTAPTSNPTAGFVWFTDPADSKLKVRGSSGTVTTVAVP